MNSYLECFEGAIREWDRETAIRLHRKAGFVIDLLDQLGWDVQADRDEFDIEMEREPLTEWLIRQNGEIRATIGSDTLTLRLQERGETDHFYGDWGQTQSVEHTRATLKKDVDRAEIFSNLLSRLRQADLTTEAVA